MDRIQQLKNVTADSSLQDIQSSFGEDADGGDDSEGRHTLLDSLLEELQVQLQMKSFQSSLEATLDRKAEEAGEELEEEEEATAAPDDIDAGECSGCRKGWAHVCPLDQSQSEPPEKPSQDRSKLSSSQVEDEYLRLRQENETFLKEHPVASQRSQEEKSRLQKIRDRMKKVRGQMSKGNPDTVRMTQSQGKGRSDRKEPTGKRSRRNDGNENPDEGHETKR